MYSGFISSKRSVAAVGVHQRFDTVAYRMVAPFFDPKGFPELQQIIHFEGINGPDGLKVKSPGEGETSHLYDPITETGPVPELIESHYKQLVKKLKAHDMIGAAFEASWLAHYVCDGLTPAHHYPLDKELEAHGFFKNEKGKYDVDRTGLSEIQKMRLRWIIIGGKGLLSTHINFEIGVATAILGQRIKVKLDSAKLAEARKNGPIEFFKREAKDIADLKMYDRFYDKGWTPELARMTKTRLAPQIVQTIGIIWLLAYLETGEELVKDVLAAKEVQA